MRAMVGEALVLLLIQKPSVVNPQDCPETLNLDLHTCWLDIGALKLCSQLQVEPSSLREAGSAMRAIVGEALLLLIQRPSAISPQDCPETLILDLQRLVAAQNELQRLSLIGASLLVAQMLLGAKNLPSSAVTVENRRCSPWPWKLC